MMQMSNEYAVALFMLASEENCREDIAKGLDVINSAFEENGEYEELLNSPAIPASKRLEIIDEAFGNLHEYAVSFLKILCERRLVKEIKGVVEEYNKLLEASSNISTAKVTSAVELTDKEKDAVLKKIEDMIGHTVTLETEVDSSLIGGMIIETDGKVIDASLRQRISDVKDVIGG